MTMMVLPKRRMLVREFIEYSLYDAKVGYFQQTASVMSEDDACIDLSSIRNQSDYSGRMQAKLHNTWATPSVLWQAWYARALSGHIRRPIVYELGPGRGALARNLLAIRPDLCEYHLVERSTPMHEHQKGILGPDPRVRFHLQDLPKGVDERPCTVVMAEVLDNLAHDLVRVEDDGTLSQALVLYDSAARFGQYPGALHYDFVPNVADPVLRQCVQLFYPYLKANVWDRILGTIMSALFEDYFRARSCHFIPSGAFQLLQTLSRRLPNAELLVLDFDALPDALPSFGNAPVVQAIYSKSLVQRHLSTKVHQPMGTVDDDDRESIALDTLLVKPGLCDIFFPTDFGLLARMVRHFWPRTQHIRVGKHPHLMLQAEQEVLLRTTAKSGFNPLLHTFGNMSYLISKND